MKLSERADIEKAEKLLAELDAHPATTKYREDKAAEILATRLETAGRIAALRNEESAVLPKLKADLEEKEAVHAAAKSVLEGAAVKVQVAALALRQARVTFGTAIGNCEASLFESADPEIDAAILFFRDKLDFLRTPGRISRNAVGAVRNIFTEKKTVKEENNVPAINSAMNYCRAAITALEQMKLLPAMDTEKIAALKAGIPKIDVYTEYTGEKPLPRDPPTEIEKIRMDDAAGTSDYLLKKLHEKIDKWNIGASAGKRDIPGPAPKPAQEPTLETYKRTNRGHSLAGAFKYGIGSKR
jgi:hypothetical protein